MAHGQHQERGDLCFHLVGRALPDRESAPEEESMSAWKNRVVVLTMILENRLMGFLRSTSPRVEGILPNEPQRSMGLRTLLESGEPNSL